MEWKTEALGDIAFMTSGGTPSKKHPEYYENGTIPWVRSGELENGAIRDTEIKITPAGLDSSSAKIFPKGTLLIALYGATIGKLAYLDIDACTNQAVCGIFENDKVSLKYLYYFLLFHRPDLVKQGIGGAQPNISQTILKKLLVSYPVDKVEQHRIVARIEELFSELDNGVETLQKTKQQLAVYRQAVYSSVFTDDLPMHVITEYFDISGGLTKNSKRNELAIKMPYLRVANVYYNQLDLSEIKYIGVTEEEIERCTLEKDDLMFVEGNGSKSQIGRVAIWDGSIDYCLHQNHLIKGRPNGKMLPKYALYYLISSGGRKQITEVAKSTSGLYTLSTNKIRELYIPYCDLKQQQAMVDRIELRLDECTHIEQTVQLALQQAEAMRQSILKQAFEGRL
ncbi:MAG: restriction endonuclease subunit S [Clostridia bacterium]|nr:restriction endonuclease subunit S [Clostridia bacterium]